MTNQKLFAKIETPEQADIANRLCNLPVGDNPSIIHESLTTLLVWDGKTFRVNYAGDVSDRNDVSGFEEVVATGLQGQEEAVRGIAEIVGIVNQIASEILESKGVDTVRYTPSTHPFFDDSFLD